MNARSRWKRTCALLIALAAACPAVFAAADWPPNIVIILADDFGYGSLGAYGADSKLIHTPHMDRLAREGRRFTQAYTPSSVCTPTRYALVTGRYCWRTRLNHGGVANTFDPLLIEPSRPTIASLLKRHGYATAFVGKWHLGYGTAPRVDCTKELKPGPLELGFDYQFAVPQNHNDITRVFVENHRVAAGRGNGLRACRPPNPARRRKPPPAPGRSSSGRSSTTWPRIRAKPGMSPRSTRMWRNGCPRCCASSASAVTAASPHFSHSICISCPSVHEHLSGSSPAQ